MNQAAQWWYMQELQRKRRSVESDLELADQRLKRLQDLVEPSRRVNQERDALRREVEHLGHRLTKLKRGLLF